jgi:hypothetical protein
MYLTASILTKIQVFKEMESFAVTQLVKMAINHERSDLSIASLWAGIST